MTLSTTGPRADAKTDPASVLYVGNSYLSFNNGIGWHVLASSCGDRAGTPLAQYLGRHRDPA